MQVDDKHYCCVRERLAQLEVRNAVIHGHNDTFPLEVCGKICDFTTDLRHQLLFQNDATIIEDHKCK